MICSRTSNPVADRHNCRGFLFANTVTVFWFAVISLRSHRVQLRPFISSHWSLLSLTSPTCQPWALQWSPWSSENSQEAARGVSGFPEVMQDCHLTWPAEQPSLCSLSLHSPNSRKRAKFDQLSWSWGVVRIQWHGLSPGKKCSRGGNTNT